MIESNGQDELVLRPIDGIWSSTRNPNRDQYAYLLAGQGSKKVKQLTVDEILRAAEAPANAPRIEAHPPGLLSTLKPHQQRSLAWALHREHADGEIQVPSKLHPLWRAWMLPNGLPIYQCWVPPSRSIWTLRRFDFPTDHLLGGILADEVGLG